MSAFNSSSANPAHLERWVEWMTESRFVGIWTYDEALAVERILR